MRQSPTIQRQSIGRAEGGNLRLWYITSGYFGDKFLSQKCRTCEYLILDRHYLALRHFQTRSLDLSQRIPSIQCRVQRLVRQAMANFTGRIESRICSKDITVYCGQILYILFGDRHRQISSLRPRYSSPNTIDQYEWSSGREPFSRSADGSSGMAIGSLRIPQPRIADTAEEVTFAT